MSSFGIMQTCPWYVTFQEVWFKNIIIFDSLTIMFGIGGDIKKFNVMGGMGE
jgi:hypothetical protein